MCIRDSVQTLHRVRSLLMRDRIAQGNQIRGLLAEYGVIVPQGSTQVRKLLPAILEDAANDLTVLTRQMFAELYERLVALDERIALSLIHI